MLSACRSLKSVSSGSDQRLVYDLILVTVLQKFGDLVGLDLEELSDKCQAIYNIGSDAAETQDPATFASTALHPTAKQGLPHCQYYLGRCYETSEHTSCLALGT